MLRSGTRMWSWYGVKTLYRTTAVGKPAAVDVHFDASVDLVEERVVLFRVDAFPLFDPPAAGVEVFSTTFLIAKEEKDAELIRARVVPPEPAAAMQKRRNFLDEKLNARP